MRSVRNIGVDYPYPPKNLGTHVTSESETLTNVMSPPLKLDSGRGWSDSAQAMAKEE